MLLILPARALFVVAASLAFLAGAAACDPILPQPDRDVPPLPTGGGYADGGAADLVVVAEPPAPLDAAPRVLRLHAALAGRTLDPDRLALIEGSIGPGQLRELVRGMVSSALDARRVKALAWREAEGVALAPVEPLEPGALYTLVAADVPQAIAVRVAAMDGAPLLPRVWPPRGGSGTASLAVWCGDASVPSIDTAASMAPAGTAGRIVRGAVASGAGARCLRFEVDANADGGAVVASVPPPAVTSADDPAITVRLDPRPLEVDADPVAIVALACDAGEVPFGPGCATVADDRLYARAPAAALLWAVTGAGTDTVVVTAPGDPFVIAGLPPATDVVLDVTTVDARGAVVRTPFTATTSAPAPHVVINEVLADPLGPERASEWVEIVNDGPAAADLDGYLLSDGAGFAPLPQAMLPPGAFALLVDTSFAASNGVDVDPAPGTLILRVAHLGKAGLSNAGEVLTLLDAGGQAISRFPAAPKPKAGSSVARRLPSAPDALTSSFALAAPSPGRTNTW